jgi:hypothetical protein
MARARAQPIKPFTNGMRSPVVAPVTRGLLGVPLFLLTTQTDTFFAWTISIPMTAAVLGANYWSSTALALLAARERVWANGRLSISVALVFAPVTTAATFIHLDQFHLDNPIGWFWVLAYGIYPVMLLVLLYRQLRIPGGDPPRTRPLPLWVRATFAVHAIVLLPVGMIMFVAPGVAGDLWPWSIPDLSSRALSAWVLAFGVLAAHAFFENDFDRVKIALLGYPVFVVLHVIAIARFGEDVQWGEVGAWLYVAYLTSAASLGAYGVAGWRRARLAARVPPSEGGTGRQDVRGAPAPS